MKNRGFTLIELLAVIIIISILVMMILPRITNSVNNYSSETDELILSMIKQGAGLYVDDNSSKFLQIDGNKYCVAVNELVKKDYLKDNIEYKGEDITYTKTIEVTYNNGFEYELKDECIPTHYVIEYSGVGNNNYIELVEPGDKLKVEFTNFLPPKVVVYQNGVRLNKNKYTYENNVLIIDSVEGNIEIEYREKVYLAQLPENAYFKIDEYREKIKSVSFVDYIYEDFDNTLATYDLSANQDESIIGWIDKDYNLFIGSDWNIYSEDLSYAFYNMAAVENIAFNGLNTSELKTMYKMFAGATNLVSLNLSNFDTSSVTNMGYVFGDNMIIDGESVANSCSSLKTLDVSNFDTSNVTDMQYMFYGMENLTQLDVNSFDTSKVTNMRHMFEGLNKVTTLDVSKFDTSNVTNMYGLFSGMSALTTLNVSNFDTSKVTNMVYMFYGMQNLESLDVSNFNTSKVTNMKHMFEGLNKVTTLDVSNFDTTNVTEMASMFQGMKSLTSLNLNNFNTSQVTRMDAMFHNCKSLASLDLSNFDTSKVTVMASMFQGMSGLKTLNVSNFDTSKVTNMYGMFYEMSNLTSLDLSSFNTNNVMRMDYMFWGDSSLNNLNFSIADFSNVSNYDSMFVEVPDNSNIIVKDETQKNWITSRFSNLTGVEVIDS